MFTGKFYPYGTKDSSSILDKKYYRKWLQFCDNVATAGGKVKYQIIVSIGVCCYYMKSKIKYICECSGASKGQLNK